MALTRFVTGFTEKEEKIITGVNRRSWILTVAAKMGFFQNGGYTHCSVFDSGGWPLFHQGGQKNHFRQFIETFKKEWEIKNISEFNYNCVLFDFKAQQNEEDILETMLSTSKEPEQLIKPETP